MSTVKSIPTCELVSELLDRYQECLFIGCNPLQHVGVNGTPQRAQPTVDVNSKLSEGNVSSVLRTILTKILGRITVTCNR